MVSFEKLWFLQRAHAARYASTSKQGVATSMSPAHDLTELAVKPLVKVLEHDLKHHSGRFKFYQSIPDGAPRLDFVRSIVYADANNYKSPTDFAARNAFFFGAPSISMLLESQVPELRLHRVSRTLESTVAPDVFLPFFDNFFEIAEPDWNIQEIKSWTTSIIDQGTTLSIAQISSGQITVEDEVGFQAVQKPWAKLVYQYLRWAISARMPGPDVVQMMNILGKEESIRRLQTARELVVSRNELRRQDALANVNL